MSCNLVLGLLLGEQVLLQGDAELLAQGLELGEVLLVLLLVLDLGLDTCCAHAGQRNSILSSVIRCRPAAAWSSASRGLGGGEPYPRRRARRWGSR